jgi:hypothetical protein
VHEPALGAGLLLPQTEDADGVADARAAEVVDAQGDSPQRPMMAPPVMSRPPRPMRYSLMTVSKYE